MREGSQHVSFAPFSVLNSYKCICCCGKTTHHMSIPTYIPFIWHVDMSVPFSHHLISHLQFMGVIQTKVLQKGLICFLFFFTLPDLGITYMLSLLFNVNALFMLIIDLKNVPNKICHCDNLADL